MGLCVAARHRCKTGTEGKRTAPLASFSFRDSSSRSITIRVNRSSVPDMSKDRADDVSVSRRSRADVGVSDEWKTGSSAMTAGCGSSAGLACGVRSGG